MTFVGHACDQRGSARTARAGLGVNRQRDYGLGAAAPHGRVFGYGAIDEGGIERGLDALRAGMP